MPNSLKGTGLEQSNLGPNIAGTGPVFSVRRSTSQAVTSNLPARVQLTEKQFDSANAFDNVTNFRFQPIVAGYYQISYAVYGVGAGGTNLVNAYLRGKDGIIGGTVQSQGAYVYTTTAYVDGTSAGSELIYMNGTTDYVELWVFLIGSGACLVTQCKLQGFLARAA